MKLWWQPLFLKPKPCHSLVEISVTSQHLAALSSFLYTFLLFLSASLFFPPICLVPMYSIFSARCSDTCTPRFTDWAFYWCVWMGPVMYDHPQRSYHQVKSSRVGGGELSVWKTVFCFPFDLLVSRKKRSPEILQVLIKQHKIKTRIRTKADSVVNNVKQNAAWNRKEQQIQSNKIRETYISQPEH